VSRVSNTRMIFFLHQNAVEKTIVQKHVLDKKVICLQDILNAQLTKIVEIEIYI